MLYLTTSQEIQNAIELFTQKSILWLDTEVADYLTKKPRLSLILITTDHQDLTGEKTYILDVLDQPKLVKEFVNKIMLNADIEKVFHNAIFDLKFLGKNQAENVTCTLKLARKFPYYLLPLPNLQLKTLAGQVGKFPPVDKTEQKSDWGKRPLTDQQLKYAQMDPVYLAAIHLYLLELINNEIMPDPATENLTKMEKRYDEISKQAELLNSEVEHLKERIKAAMQIQKIKETSRFKLSSYSTERVKVDFTHLAKVTQSLGINLDFQVTLTKELQNQLGAVIDQLDVDRETNTILKLNVKEDTNLEEEEIDF